MTFAMAVSALAQPLPDGWEPVKPGARAGVEEGKVVFTPEAAGPIRRALETGDLREARVRFRVGDPVMVGFGVGIEAAGVSGTTSLRGDGMFGWRGPTPHYAGPRWTAESTYEVRYVFEDNGFHAQLVMADGIARTTGHVERYRADLPAGWRGQPMWLTVGGAAKDAEGRVELLEVRVLGEGDEAPDGPAAAGSTLEGSLAKYRQLREGRATEAIERTVEELRGSAADRSGDEGRFEVQAWDAQKLRPLLATDEGTRLLAGVYTLLQMRSPPEADVAERMRRHGLGFALYVNTRQARYEEALAGSPHVRTAVPMKGEVRERVNVFSGDWLELSTVGTLHQIRAAAMASPLKRVLLDSEYSTGVGDDPLSAAALDADEPGVPLTSFEPPSDRFTKVFADDDPVWRSAAWRSRWGVSNVGHRAIADAAGELWPGVEITTDPIDDKADLEQFRGLDLVQHWVRVHWAPRHPRSVAYYAERGRVHERNHASVRGVVIGAQLGRDNRRTPPDMLSEAGWMAVAFGARGVTHWGNQAIFNEDGGFVEGAEPAWEALRRLRAEVYDPLAERMTRWSPPPRRMAMLLSRSDAITDAGRRRTHAEATENTYRAILSTGEPCDVVYDAEVLEGRLAEYRVLIVPSLYTATESLVAQIRAFAEAGGTVVAHEGSVLKGVKGLKVLREDLAPRYRDYWIRRGEPSLLPHEYAEFLHGLAGSIGAALPFEPAIEVDSPRVVGNLLDDGEERFLVLVNDARAYGPEAEALGNRFMLDEGERVTVRVRVAGAGGYRDGLTGEAIAMEGGRAVVELEPGWGRVIRLD